MNRNIYGIAIAIVGLLLFSQVALSQSVPDAQPSAEVEQQAQDLADSVMSPFCPGRTLSACPSALARDLRLKIIAWLGEGKSPAEVKQKLFELYGKEILGTPSKQGFGLVAWFTPVFFVVAGLLIVVLVLKNMFQADLPAKSTKVTKMKLLDDMVESEIEKEINQRLIHG